MMNTLLESRPQKKRSTGGTLFSVFFHTGLVLFAVFATARAGVTKDDPDKAVKVNFVKTAEPPKPFMPSDDEEVEVSFSDGKTKRLSATISGLKKL